MAGLADIQAAGRPADWTIRYTRGDTISIQFQVRDGRNRPVDITGLVVTAVASPAWGHPLPVALTVTVDDPLTGLLTVSWPPELGVLLPTRGVWSLTLGDGATWIKTLVTGQILESPDGVVQCGCTQVTPCQC